MRYNDMPRLGIVIINCNGENLIIACLKSLAKQSKALEILKLLFWMMVAQFEFNLRYTNGGRSCYELQEYLKRCEESQKAFSFRGIESFLKPL